jgi:hypothetical protein
MVVRTVYDVYNIFFCSRNIITLCDSPDVQTEEQEETTAGKCDPLTPPSPPPPRAPHELNWLSNFKFYVDQIPWSGTPTDLLVKWDQTPPFAMCVCVCVCGGGGDWQYID